MTLRLFAAPACLLCVLCAQELPDGATLMKQQGEAMKKHRSLQFTTVMTMEMTRAGEPTNMNMEVAMAYVNPGKMRMDSKVQGIGITMVSDGESTLVYNSMSKQYARRPAAMGPAGTLSAMGINMPDISKVSTATKTLRAETIVMDGQKHDCWVVEYTIGKLDMPGREGAPATQVSDAVMTYWLDKQLSIDLKLTTSMNMQMMGQPVQMRQTMVKKDLKIDQPVPDSLFAFTPPADAKEVPELFGSSMPKGDLAGKDAPAFEVKDLDAKPYSLASLKGKPVLLDFWATWCAPCRKSLPVLEKMYQEYKDQGLVILGVDAGEDRDTVQGFLKTTPAPYPVILGGDSEIQAAFHVSAFPTFVLIGRDGKVVAHEIGYGGEPSLRGMLEKAGLKPPAAGK